MQTLSELTCSIGENIYLREMESEKTTILRNVLFKSFAEKESWRKNDLKKVLIKFMKDNGVEDNDQDIDKVINMFTQ